MQKGMTYIGSLTKEGTGSCADLATGLGLGNQEYSTGMLMLSLGGICHIDGTSEGAGRRRSEYENRELKYFWFTGNDKHCSR
eukprot:8972245-Heterocapsa_arctica.AAC.1